jgi:hypothetical protein
MRASLAQAAGAWVAPAAVASLAFGGILVFRNSAAGVPWTSPAVFCGIPAAVFMSAALAAACLVHGSLGLARGRLDFLRTVPLYAAVASFALFSILGYQSVREWNTEPIWRKVGGVASGLAAAPIAYWLASTRAARPITLWAITIGLFFVGSAAVATWIVNHPGVAEAKDPRDLVAKYEPVASAPARDKAEGRVYVLGIDGITWDRIDPLIAKNRLPNFAKLRSAGATARLRTYLPTASPSIWTTIATGQPPQVHQINDFVIQRAGFLPSYELVLQNRGLRWMFSRLGLHNVVPVSSNLRFCKALWTITKEMGIPTSVAGWWASFPAEETKGWIVTDQAVNDWLPWLFTNYERRVARTAGTTYPEELAKQIEPLQRSPESVTREELSRFVPVDDADWAEFLAAKSVDHDRPTSVFRYSYLRDEFLVAATLDIDTKNRPEIVLCYTRLTDDVSHLFWEYSEAEAKDLGVDPKKIEKYRDVVDKTLEWADGIVGKFIERLGPADTLLVLSDHGWERVSKGVYHHFNAPDGVIAFYGANVKPGVLEKSPHVLDVLPTILWLAGIPKGADMPGRALREAFKITREERTIPTWETNRSGTAGIYGMLGSGAQTNLLEQIGYVKR